MSVNLLTGLEPDTEYEISVQNSALRMQDSKADQTAWGITENKACHTAGGQSKDPTCSAEAEDTPTECLRSSMRIRTEAESVTLNVKDFGALPDLSKDATACIQAAILCCPANGRVLIPKGTYTTGPLFLKSHIRIEIEREAMLIGTSDRSSFPILPGMIRGGGGRRGYKQCEDVESGGYEYSQNLCKEEENSGSIRYIGIEDGDFACDKNISNDAGGYDATSRYSIASWEGDPVDAYASIITGIGIKDVVIYGEGTINGNGQQAGWYDRKLLHRVPSRPRVIFLSHCSNIAILGTHIINSPSWTVHPYFTDRFRVIGATIVNPQNSPNTDGFDPESCNGVEAIGVRFSVGDDCIAVKSGKIYMGRTFKTPCSDIRIRQCLMEYGHGAVTIGSEMSGGVNDMIVEDCVFHSTDRGFRLKTRRGRGKDAVIKKIVVKNVAMEGVKIPFVVNSFYFCDTDGKSSYVQDRECLPVDGRTPEIDDLTFEGITCTETHSSSGWICGLPEKKIGHLTFRDIYIDFAKDALPFVPAMALGLQECVKKGFFISNVRELSLEGIIVKGCEGRVMTLENVDSVFPPLEGGVMGSKTMPDNTAGNG